MKRFVAIASTTATAVAFSILTSSVAQAENSPCFDDYTAQVRAINAESNARIAEMGPEYASSPEITANVERANQLIRERHTVCDSALAPPVVASSPSPVEQVPAPTPACPYDMSTQEGRDALQRHIIESSQRVGQGQRQYGPNGNLELAVENINDQRNTTNITLACKGIDAPPLSPVMLPQEPVPAGTPARSPNCTDLNNAWSSLDLAVPVIDRFLQLRKLPGFGLVSGAQLIGCGISGIPAAIANPTPDNQNEVFIGICNGLNPLPVDVCGNTPAG